MNSAFTRFSLAIAVLFVSCNAGFAQWRSESIAMNTGNSAPLYASPPIGENIFSPDRSRIYVSGFLGLNSNMNFGEFSFDCDCQWEGGYALENIGAMVGVDITYQWAPNWAVIGKFYYDNKHTTEAYERSLTTPIKFSTEVIVRPVEYEEIASVSLSYATAGLFLRWQPRLERWYVFAGPAVGYVLSSGIEHTQKIVTPELTFREILDTERISKDGDFTAIDTRIEAILGFGYDYIVRPRWYINPEIRFGFPVTEITEDELVVVPPGDDPWKVASFQISIGLKYEAF
jgi:outer membrane protein with beta-barrel domain